MGGDGAGSRPDWIAVGALSIAWAIPILLSPYAPGGDTPWHAAVVAVLADPERFAGFFAAAERPGFGSYVAVYRGLALVAGAIGAAAAVQVLCALHAIGWVWAARSLARSFGVDGTAAVLIAPAVYSTTLEFGFLVYLPSLPLTLWTWSQVVSVMRGGGMRSTVGLGVAWLGVSLCHPFAAAVAGLGAGLLGSCEVSAGRGRRAVVVAGVLAVGALPAAMALGSVPRGGGGHAAGGDSLGSRLAAQVFLSPLESVARAPAQVIGFVDETWRWVMVVGLLGCAVAWRLGATRAASSPGPASSPERVSSGPTASRRAPLYLFLLVASLYLVTPFTFEWPRNWYGAQPRLAPLLWATGLVAIGPRSGGGVRWGRGAAVVVSAMALAVVVFGGLGAQAAEGRDLAAVIARSAPGVRTLGLIEQRPAVDREPPESFRNATGWLVAAAGGFASHLPIAESGGLNSGEHIPVHRAPGAPAGLRAPPLGVPRAFRWERHAAGWDQFLIRDRDPDRPHDYFAGHAGSVVEVARSGRWRLVRRVE